MDSMEFLKTWEEFKKSYSMDKLAFRDNDITTIMVFALRYALPRHSYAFGFVSDFVLRHIGAFEDWDLEGMIEDCEMYYPNADCGGDICDQPAVDRFVDKLKEILKERKA